MHDLEGTTAPSQAGDLMGGPPVLAELPDLEAPVSHRPAEPEPIAQDGRFMGQRISTKLLVGAAGVLVIVAVGSWLLKSNDSGSTDSDLPAWQTNMPAPTADEAPQWNTQPVEAVTPTVPTATEPSGITAVDPMPLGVGPESAPTTPYPQPPELVPARVQPEFPPSSTYPSPPAYEGRYQPRPAQPGYGQVYPNSRSEANRPMRVGDRVPARTDAYRHPPRDVNRFDHRAVPPAQQMDRRAAPPDRRWPQSAQTAPSGTPGIARLEGFIAKPPVRMTNDPTRSRLH